MQGQQNAGNQQQMMINQQMQPNPMQQQQQQNQMMMMANGPNNPMAVNRMQGNMGGNPNVQHQQAVRRN